MKFDWHKLREDRAGTLVTIKEVPAILIRFYRGEDYIDIYGLVDSGADETMLPAWVARKLGIEITTGELRKGVGCGGPFDFYYFKEIKVSVGVETAVYRKGDTYFVPAGAPHAARIKAGSRLLDIFDEGDRYRP